MPRVISFPARRRAKGACAVVARPLAPERCVTLDHTVSPDHVILVGEDLSGAVRIRVELAREDATEWWVDTIRQWLAERHDARPALTIDR